MAVRHNGPAPYAPPATVLAVIGRWRNHNVPTPFTTEVLERIGVSSSLAARTLQALKLLDLIDAEGSPMEILNDLSITRTDEIQKSLREMLNAAYEEVMGIVDVEQDSYERVEDAFRGYTPRGQRSRMVTLFLGLCEAAGLKTPASPTRPQGAAAGASRQARVSPKKTTPVQRQRKAAAEPRGLPSALQGLLDELPSPGGGWTRKQRSSFMKVFESVLDFAYPIIAEGGNQASGNGSEEGVNSS